MERKSNQQVFGIRAVIEAIESGKEIESLMIQKGISGDLFRELRKLIDQYDIKYQYVPIEKLNRICKGNHQGVFAFISPISFHKVEDLIPFIFENGETPLLLVLDRITDVRNFGAIARTAECAGVHGIVVPMRESAAIHSDSIKTSAGALFRIPVCRVSNLKRTIEYMQESGLQVVACTEKNDESIYTTDFSTPTAIVMGSEEDGISNDILRIVDKYAKIPLLGEIESLNVSVATGVILYEALRQRMK
ncbi:MAG: 23S rRNA (guanosine(2251)-2'-O)-methyltransferase RlmB [bacterium]|jgi:23S rRNA (guanosine2251-2'-O)-methyltransferase